VLIRSQRRTFPERRPARVIAHFFAVADEGLQLKKANTDAAPAAPGPRDRGEPIDRAGKNWKPYPCLLTRAELKAIIA
jgi:hypothetical protein